MWERIKAVFHLNWGQRTSFSESKVQENKTELHPSPEQPQKPEENPFYLEFLRKQESERGQNTDLTRGTVSEAEKEKASQTVKADPQAPGMLIHNLFSFHPEGEFLEIENNDKSKSFAELDGTKQMVFKADAIALTAVGIIKTVSQIDEARDYVKNYTIVQRKLSGDSRPVNSRDVQCRGTWLYCDVKLSNTTAYLAVSLGHAAMLMIYCYEKETLEYVLDHTQYMQQA